MLGVLTVLFDSGTFAVLLVDNVQLIPSDSMFWAAIQDIKDGEINSVLALLAFTHCPGPASHGGESSSLAVTLPSLISAMIHNDLLTPSAPCRLQGFTLHSRHLG